MSLPATPQRLFDEILLMIFRETQLPSWMTDYVIPPTLAPFRGSPSCADLYTRRTITEVSKAWYNLGVALLYEKITLRRLDQLPALLWALEARESLRPLVRSLEITFLAPWNFLEYHDFEIRKIVELCPRLSHFGYFPANDQHFELHHRLLPSPSSTGSAITSLGFTFLPGTLLQPALIQHCRNLRSLSLVLLLPMTPSALEQLKRRSGPDARRRCEEEEHHPLPFDNLEVLHITVDNDSAIRDTWSMPRLQRVSLRGKMNHQTSGLLAPFGGTIASLSLYDLHFAASSALLLQRVLDSCPKLDHLALSVSLFDPALRHPTITAIDIFCLGWTTPGVIQLRSLSARFPALQTLRTLDESMRFLRDIPRSLPQSVEFARLWEWAAGHSDDASSD
ncbi:hypothetical protein C8F04DRAFT_302486 [Mycena alexandri]|uniref:Uncharacterized protein n=1 Tax=Mycena alexandri TaxID=1745969 RepID=A0AAD6S719_9AGAR|nr:hypothetical protein C8F04DRAFT_302486 [Mycena alexandri]